MSQKKLDIFREIAIVLVLSLILVSLLTIKVVNAQAGQVTLKPTDDTYVEYSNQNSNYGGQTHLDIEYFIIGTPPYQLTYIDIVWLKFNLSSVPDGAVVDVATLQLYTLTTGETFDVHTYSCSDNSWTELTLTYSNMPSYNTTSMDSALVATGYQWYNWSVVDAVTNVLNSHSSAMTIVMNEPSPHSAFNNVWFDSKEAPVYVTDYSPKLTIHWSSVVPEFPTFIVLPLFMIATLLAVIVYRKKLAKISGSP
jgi:hypothetical protein